MFLFLHVPNLLGLELGLDAPACDRATTSETRCRGEEQLDKTGPNSPCSSSRDI